MKESGISLSGVLLVVFMVLKLTDVIDWSWLWVLSPLWLPLVFVLGMLGISVLVAVLLLIKEFVD